MVAGLDEEKERVLELLREIKKKNIQVVVEGVKDKRALEAFGIKNVVTLTKPLYAVVEDIAASTSEVVLLTDLDAEGKKLYHTLSRDLQKFGVRVKNELREFLFTTKLRHIEGLRTYLQNSHKKSDATHHKLFTVSASELQKV